MPALGGSSHMTGSDARIARTSMPPATYLYKLCHTPHTNNFFYPQTVVKGERQEKSRRLVGLPGWDRPAGALSSQAGGPSSFLSLLLVPRKETKNRHGALSQHLQHCYIFPVFFFQPSSFLHACWDRKRDSLPCHSVSSHCISCLSQDMLHTPFKHEACMYETMSSPEGISLSSQNY